jgi:hypothetical protein
MDEALEMFKQLRDISDEIVKAIESKDEKAAETALGKFMIWAVKFNAL